MDRPALDYAGLFDASPNPYLVLDRSLNIVGANRAYLVATKRELADIVGRWAWDAFPTDPETLRRSVASFRRVLRTGEPDTLALLRFDIPRPEAEGGFEERYWSIVHAPVPDGDGEVALVLQHPIDVTELQRLRDGTRHTAPERGTRLEPAQSGIFSRAHAVQEANRWLQAEGDRLRRLFEQAPGFMCALRGPEHRFELANAAYLRLVGDRDLVGKPVREVLPELEGQGFFDLLDRVFATGETFVGRGMEITLRAAPGTAFETRFLDFVYQPVTDLDGRVSGIFVQGNDVTEAERAAHALRAERDRSRGILESMAEGFLLLDRDFRVVEINAEGLRIDGRPREAIVGRPLLEVWPEAEHMPTWPAYREAMAERVPVSVEYRHASGAHDVWLDVRAYPVADGGLAMIYRDVTDRKRAEAALRESEARFRHMADSAPALIWMTDAEGRVTFANRHYDLMFGRPAADILGEGWTEIVLPEDLERHTAAFFAAFRARAPFRTETRVRDKDGRVRWLRCEGVPRLDDAGAFLGYTGCNVDITEARFAAEELEARVAERTAELRDALGRLHAEVLERERAEDALRQAQKMEAVGQLTGGIAHDFNNMLQGIGGALELARRRVEQGRVPDAFALMDAAHQGVTRAAGLTHRLLAFARRQALDPKPVVLDGLVRGMEELIRRTVGPNVTVELRPGDGTWPVLCDANQMENTLLNLAINARDAMSGVPLGTTPAGGTLTLATAEVRLSVADVAGQGGAGPGEYVELAVSDTGTGMTPEVAARAFEPFFTTKPIGQGTGLGLSQLYGFVRQSGGFVRLDSAPGRGTTVRLYLPRHAGDGTVPQDEAPERPEARAGTVGTVLLVEDEAAVRAVAAERLRELGYAVLEAGDGPAALRLLRPGARVDLLVTDVGLPGGMNGRQVADAARERRPNLPVLFITGYAGPALGAHLAPGMEVIGKPFALDALATKVRAMLEASPVA